MGNHVIKKKSSILVKINKIGLIVSIMALITFLAIKSFYTLEATSPPILRFLNGKAFPYLTVVILIITGFIYIINEIIPKISDRYFADFFSTDKIIPFRYLEIISHVVFNRLELRGIDGIESKNEVLNYLLVEKFIEDNFHKIKSVKMLLEIKNDGFMPVFLKKFQLLQHELLKENKHITSHNIEKRYVVLDPTEYNMENFSVDKKDSHSVHLIWLNQINYSDIFFYEGLPKNNISVFHRYCPLDFNIKRFPRFEATGVKTVNKQEWNEQERQELANSLDKEFKNKELIIIETKKSFFLAETVKRTDTFGFKKSYIKIIDKKELRQNEEVAKRIELVNRLFNELSAIQDANWEPNYYEYILLSSENIKTTPQFEDVIFAVDYYGDSDLSSWTSPTSPKWIVWKACQAAIIKGQDPDKNPPLIRRLFIVDESVLKNTKKLADFLSVIAMQLSLGIEVKIIKKELYLKWITQDCPTKIRDKFKNSFDIKRDILDYEFILRDDEVFKGVNFSGYGGGCPIQGPIFKGDNKWKELSDLLWNDVSFNDYTTLNCIMPQASQILSYYFKMVHFDIKENEDLKKLIIEDGSFQLEKVQTKLREKLNQPPVSFNDGNEKLIIKQYNFWENYWGNENSKLYEIDKYDSILEKYFTDSNSKEIILEIGCGDGRNTHFLMRKCKKVYALDQSFNALEKLNTNLNGFENFEKVILQAAYAHFTEFKNDFFDKIVCFDFFNHCIDWNPFLKEFYRILKPEGVLIANALSESDDSCNSYRNMQTNSKFEKIDEYKFFNHDPLNSDNNSGSLVMNFSSQQSIENEFDRNKWSIEEISEYSRNDNAHQLPFNQNDHEHKFWEIVAKRK